MIWAAGVLAAGVSSLLAEASGAETDQVGRLLVEPDLSLPGHPEVLAIGDMVQIRGADPLPGVAPVAMQMGRYAAQARQGHACAASDVGPFKYKDKGNLATIGRGARGGRAAAAASGPGASRPGRCGSGSTSSTWSASRTGCWCSSAGASASSPTAAGRG